MPHRSVLAGSGCLQALGQALRAQRLERALTQEALAVDAEVERSYLGAIERGEVNVTAHVLCRICAAMQLKPSELFLSAGY
jgi:transcriptional regulator with XRE-family HTH domain